MKEIFVLNKPFDGSYMDDEGNIAHEIIDFFVTDNGDHYIYNNPDGQFRSNYKDYTIKRMFLTSGAKMGTKKDKNGKELLGSDGKPIKTSTFRLEYMIEIEEVLHNYSRLNEKLSSYQENLKQIIKEKNIIYSGLPLDQIYGDLDQSLYVTFKAKKILKAKNPIWITTEQYQFYRNKGYVKSDDETHKQAFKALNDAIASKEWEEFHCNSLKNETPISVSHRRKTFLDLIMKADSEECYTNMLYQLLDWKDSLQRFITFLNEKRIIKNNLSEKPFTIKRELPIQGIKKGGRTDICAFTGKLEDPKFDDQRIVIENKLYSGLNDVQYDDKIVSTQLTKYHEWATALNEERKILEPICLIACPDFRINDIKQEIESEMKPIYKFVPYSVIREFLKQLSQEKGFFQDFVFEKYVSDIVECFNRYSHKTQQDLFKKLFLELIDQRKSELISYLS